MKVLMTADAVGGVWTYALDLSAALVAHDVSVVLATMGPKPSDAQRAQAQASSNVQLVESEYRLEWMQEPWDDVAAAGQWLLELATSHEVQVVHLNGYTHAALPWQRPVVSVAHSCVLSWWQSVYGLPAPVEWDTYQCNVGRGLNCADCVVAPTHAFLDQLRSLHWFSRPAQVIYNARAPIAPADGRRMPIVLACGRPWDVSKNMRVLDDAVQGLPWQAYVIGGVNGPDGHSFVPSALHSLGALPVDEVAPWLGCADIFVHPSLYEPFGLAVLEAANAGCALVLADIPTLRELWNDAAEFFDPCDSRALRATLVSLIADPERRRSLAAAAHERAGQYRVEQMAADYANLYETLVRSHSATERAVA